MNTFINWCQNHDWQILLFMMFSIFPLGYLMGMAEGRNQAAKIYRKRLALIQREQRNVK